MKLMLIMGVPKEEYFICYLTPAILNSIKIRPTSHWNTALLRAIAAQFEHKSAYQVALGYIHLC